MTTPQENDLQSSNRVTEQSNQESDSHAATNDHTPSKRTTSGFSTNASSLLRGLKSGVEFCGKHPFATGLFAIMGLAGLILSVKGFQLDRTEAQVTTQQIRGVEDQLEEISESVGTAFRGGVFLYEEPLEGVYSNDWWAHPLMSTDEMESRKSARLTITGEGKTVEFLGTMYINCENFQHTWSGVQNFYKSIVSEQEYRNIAGDDERVTRLVPNQVVRNARRLFCLK